MNRLVPMASTLCLLGLGCSEMQQAITDRLGAEKEAAIAVVDSQLTKAEDLLRGKTTQVADSSTGEEE